MANVIPVKATFTSSTVTGLAEFQSGDTIDISTYLSASSITFAGDSGSDSAALGETLTIAGGTNITTAATSNTITINLDSNVVTETSTDTLTNKTISGSSNTLSNIGNSSLTNSSITFAGDSGSDSASLGETLTIAGGTGIDTTGTSNTITIATAQDISTSASPTFAGLTSTANISLGDSDKIEFDSNSLEIHNTGDNSFIEHKTGNDLYIKSVKSIFFQTFNSELSIAANRDGSVDLYYDSNKKFETTSGGATVTGTMTATTFSGSGASLTNIPNSSLDNSSITFAGDSGSDSASLGETLTISGTSNEIETVGTSNTITIGLPNDVTIGNDLTVSNDLTVTGNLTVNGTTTTVNSTTIEITNSFTFEGSTADGFETTLGVIDPTADRTINLPNVSGTVITTGNLSDITSVGTLSSVTVGASGITFSDGSTQTSAGASNAFAIAQAVALG